MDAMAATAARAATDATDATAARDAMAAMGRLAQWCVQRAYWWHEEFSYLSTTHLGAAQNHATDVERWSRPVYDAFCAGVWVVYWTDTVLYWVRKPRVYVEGVADRRRLHRTDGPAVESAIEPLYFWHGVLVPVHAITAPQTITVADIQAETDAEVRRVLRERFGPTMAERPEGYDGTLAFLRAVGSRLVDCDGGTGAVGSAPRALVEIDDPTWPRWLILTDGSTRRVYTIPANPEDATVADAMRRINGGIPDEAILVEA